MMIISKSRLKANMFEIFRRIEETGEEVIVTDHNRPVLCIQPMHGGLSVEDAFGDVYGQLVFLEDPNSSTLDEWKHP